MTKRRNVIVHIAPSADSYIARPDGDLEWLTSPCSKVLLYERVHEVD
jgi:riboflavin biosynthesis pyrimidine reductase